MHLFARRLTEAELADGFRSLGLGAGSHVVLHSSYKSLGPVAGGPGAVVEALLGVIGPTGNLMVPTFTYSLPMWQVEPFDYWRSASRVGAITETVRLMPGAVRSFHPTHSVAVVGPDAEALVADHLAFTPIGHGSPLARMAERGAVIVMLGTAQDTNSSLHCAEVVSGVSYVDVPFTPGQTHEVSWFLNEHGQIEYASLRQLPGCSRGFRAAEPGLMEAGLLTAGRVGGAACQVLPAAAAVAEVARLIAAQPALLLCHLANCAICPRRRASLSAGPP